MGMHKDIYNPEEQLLLDDMKEERYKNYYKDEAKTIGAEFIVTDPGDDKQRRGRNRHQRRKMAALSRKWKR